MNRNEKATPRKMVALGALLLLAATASGCGVGLPTQPDVDAGVVNGRSAGAAGIQEIGAPLEMTDTSLPGGGSDGSDAPAPETVIPTPSGAGNGSGWAYGRQKTKWKGRH